MDAQHKTLELLARRKDGETVCPSEVARALAAAEGNPTDWRLAMPEVHRAVDHMLARGEVILSWKGQCLPARAGPYRIRRAQSR